MREFFLMVDDRVRGGGGVKMLGRDGSAVASQPRGREREREKADPQIHRRWPAAVIVVVVSEPRVEGR